MSQPPGQPPQGGFGAPQDQPPQGGFGAPRNPPPPPPQPPQPGYGYPQQPGPYGTPAPGPYGTQAPGPYGNPAPGPYGTQAPGPYRSPQPGPYGQQPGYGYPQPPYAGGPGTPPPGGPSGNGKKKALVIGAVAAALVVVGGTVYAVSGGSGGDDKPVARHSGSARPSASADPVDPGDGSGNGGSDTEDLNEGRKPGEAKVLWYKTAPDAPGSGADAPGMWITGSTAVKAAYKQVFGFRVADGKPAWSPVSFPQKICAVTPGSSGGKVVVAYMNGVSDRAECNQLQQLDLDTGKKGWHTEVPKGGLFDSSVSIELTVSGKTLIVGRSQSGVAYDIGSGRKLFEAKKYGADCFPAGFAGDSGRLIQVASCGAGGSDEHDEIRQLDPATGKVRWTRPVKKGWQVTRAYSLHPLVVYLTDEDKKAWNISTLSDTGAFRSEVKVDEKFAAGCGWAAVMQRGLQSCQGVAADSDTLYLPTDKTTGANEIVAVSLTTGKEKWRVKSPVDTSMSPIRTEGGKLIAYARPSYDTGGRIVAIPVSGSSHKPVTLLRNPDGTAEIENTFFSSAIAWADGRFYLSNTRLTGNDDAKEKLMMAYGK